MKRKAGFKPIPQEFPRLRPRCRGIYRRPFRRELRAPLEAPVRVNRCHLPSMLLRPQSFGSWRSLLRGGTQRRNSGGASELVGEVQPWRLPPGLRVPRVSNEGTNLRRWTFRQSRCRQEIAYARVGGRSFARGRKVIE